MTTPRSLVKDFVKLTLLSPDLYYTARVVKAVVIKDLSAPIILGMPFLMRSSITIDHKQHIVTDTEQGYNLLDPMIYSPNANRELSMCLKKAGKLSNVIMLLL
jgi:hypothetical protein